MAMNDKPVPHTIKRWKISYRLPSGAIASDTVHNEAGAKRAEQYHKDKGNYVGTEYSEEVVQTYAI